MECMNLPWKGKENRYLVDWGRIGQKQKGSGQRKMDKDRTKPDNWFGSISEVR